MRPTHIRVTIMKRLITFAMAAFLFGAFSLNANAQLVKGNNTNNDKPVVSKNQTEAAVKVTEKDAKCCDGKTTTVKDAKCCDAKNTVKTPETVGQKDLKVASQENWDNVIKDYETTVGQCLNIYKAMKAGKDDKALTQQFTETLTKVEGIGNKIEKAMSTLNRTQIHRYNEAKQKLAVVYQKG